MLHAESPGSMLSSHAFYMLRSSSLLYMATPCNTIESVEQFKDRPPILLGIFTAVKAGIYSFSMYAQTALADGGEFRIVRGDGELLCRAWLGNDSKNLITYIVIVFPICKRESI